MDRLRSVSSLLAQLVAPLLMVPSLAAQPNPPNESSPPQQPPAPSERVAPPVEPTPDEERTSSPPPPVAPAPSSSEDQAPDDQAPVPPRDGESDQESGAPAPSDPPPAQATENTPPSAPVAEETDAATVPVPSAPVVHPKPLAGRNAQGSNVDVTAGLDDLSLVDLLNLDLRIVSTKTDTTVAASPAAVIVVSRQDIERYGYRSVAEALQDVVGTYIVDDHITPNLGVRGVPGGSFEGSGAVKVMIDSVPVAFRTTGENWLGPALIPMASVERIEIVKGPTSSLYGADAFLGVINVITRPAGNASWGEVNGAALATYEGNPGFGLGGAGGLVLRPFRITMGAQYQLEDRSGLALPASSPAPVVADDAGELSREQKLRSGVAHMRVTYNPVRKTTYSLSARYARRQTAAEFAPWLQLTNAADPDTGTSLSLEQGTLTLGADSTFSRSFQLVSTATAFYGRTRPDDRIDTGDTFAVVERDLSYMGGEGSVEGIIRPTDDLRLVVAGELSADKEHLGAPDFRSRDDGRLIESVGTAEDFEATLVNVAGRAQVTWDLIENYLVPTGGLRIDHNSVYGERFSGRLALVSQLRSDLYVKGAYGTAFKAATPLLLYGSPLAPGDVIGSPELKPQELRSAELTVDYQPEGVVDTELSVTRWQLIDRAVFRPEEINLVGRNSADAKGWTIEAMLTSRFSDVVGGSLGGEWVQVTRQSGEVGYRSVLFGTAPAIYPEFIGRGRLWLRPAPAPIEIWTATRLVGARNASDSNTLEAGERYELPSYVSLDAGVRTLDLRWFGKRLTEFSLRGQNVLDSAKADAGFFGIDYPALAPRLTLQIRQEL